MAAEKNRARALAILGIAGGLTLFGASVPAEAQVWGGWFGGWRSEPAYAPPIPVRRVAAIVASNGYTLAGTPRRQGGVIIADAVDPRGEHMHFVLDAYDGQIIRTRVPGPPRPPGFIANAEPPAAAPSTARPAAGTMMGGAQPGLEPPHPLAKSKAAPKPKQVAAHTPPKPAATAVAPKLPSEAEHVTAPGVSVPGPAAEAKAPEATAPAALAPDAAPAAAAAPTPAIVEAKAPAAQPASDIGPAVKKVDPAPTGSTPAPAAVSAPDFTDESK